MSSFKDSFKQREKELEQNGKHQTYCPTKFIFSPSYIHGGECLVEESEEGRYYSPFRNEDGTEKQSETNRGFGRTSVRLPSVTTILGATQSKEDKEYLKKWAESQDPDGVKLRKAGNRGSALHEHCENYILGNYSKLDINNAHFQQLYPILRDRINNIHAVEAMLYSLVHRVAGRVDLIAEFDGVLSVIDFKTSTSNKDWTSITGYFIQKTIYSMMYEELYGIHIDNIVTLIAKDSSISGFEKHVKPQIFINKASDFRSEAISRINQFHFNTGV